MKITIKRRWNGRPYSGPSFQEVIDVSENRVERVSVSTHTGPYFRTGLMEGAEGKEMEIIATDHPGQNEVFLDCDRQKVIEYLDAVYWRARNRQDIVAIIEKWAAERRAKSL